MSGRRNYHRYGVTDASGCLKVVRDVTVWRDVDDEFIAVSDEAAVPGEPLALERMVGGTLITIEVSVIDSHPVIVNGRVRHRLRLRANDSHEASDSRQMRRAH